MAQIDGRVECSMLLERFSYKYAALNNIFKLITITSMKVSPGDNEEGKILVWYLRGSRILSSALATSD